MAFGGWRVFVFTQRSVTFFGTGSDRGCVLEWAVVFFGLFRMIGFLSLYFQDQGCLGRD